MVSLKGVAQKLLLLDCGYGVYDRYFLVTTLFAQTKLNTSKNHKILDISMVSVVSLLVSFLVSPYQQKFVDTDTIECIIVSSSLYHLWLLAARRELFRGSLAIIVSSVPLFKEGTCPLEVSSNSGRTVSSFLLAKRQAGRIIKT